MSHSQFVETLEARRFLSAGTAASTLVAARAAPAIVATAQRATFKPSALLGTYTGTVKLTTPASAAPIKFTVTITGINTATKTVQGSISLAKLNFTNVTMAKSTFDSKTGEFILHVITHGVPTPQILQLSLHGFVTPQSIAQKTLKHVHFNGFIPFNSKPRVAVDGYCDIKKT